MLGLKKFLFRGSAQNKLPDDVRASLEVWRASKERPLDALHCHTRYGVGGVDSRGPNPDSEQLRGIAASTI